MSLLSNLTDVTKVAVLSGRNNLTLFDYQFTNAQRHCSLAEACPTLVQVFGARLEVSNRTCQAC